MEQFVVKTYTDKELVLSSSEQLPKIYQTLHNDEVMQLIWYEKGMKKSEVVITANIVGRVRNGEMKLKSEEGEV